MASVATVVDPSPDAALSVVAPVYARPPVSASVAVAASLRVASRVAIFASPSVAVSPSVSGDANDWTAVAASADAMLSVRTSL